MTAIPISLERERFVHRLEHVVFALGVILLMYIANFFAPRAFPTPGRIINALYTQLANGNLIDATIHASYAIFTGYLIAVVIGISLGLFMGLNWYAEQLLDPYVNGLYVLPVAAVVPAFIVWFGVEFQIRVIVVVLFATIPILINTLQGVHETPPRLLEAVRSFGANRLFLIRHVILPHEIPYILAGLRIGLGRAIKGLVIVELIVSVTGFGAIISRWSAAGSIEGVFSVVIVLMAMGVLATWLMARLIDRIVYWEASEVE